MGRQLKTIKDLIQIAQMGGEHMRPLEMSASLTRIIANPDPDCPDCYSIGEQYYCNNYDIKFGEMKRLKKAYETD